MPRPLHADGFEIVASTRTPDRSKLPKPSSECRVLWRSYFRRNYACGHRDSRRFRVMVNGMETKILKQAESCPACFIETERKHLIPCALCGLPICPGEGVALYDADNDGILPNAHHVGQYVLGCLRFECAPSAGFFGGHWTREGFEPLKFG